MRQAMVLTKTFNDSDPRDPDARRAVLEQLLGSIGADVDIRPLLHVDYGSHLHVGDRAFINFG
jgi:maltose O-acetyltransferase